MQLFGVRSPFCEKFTVPSKSIAGQPPNNLLKPTPLRSGHAVAEKACHGVASTTLRVLAQALGITMKYRDNPERANKRFMALVEEMNGESDRAVAIVGAAWVEEALSDSITSFLQVHEEAHKRLFRSNAPLASFSSKIDLSKLLGIVSDTIWSDLHRIRDIRNEFAHHIAHKTEDTRLTFAAGHISDKCLALRCVEHEHHTDPRVAYTRACATLNSDFDLFTLMGDKVSDTHKVIAKGVD